jgi:hypothetical protein
VTLTGQVVEVIGEHPGSVPIQPADPQRGDHERQVRDDPFGETQFAGGFALGPAQQGGDLPVGPPAEMR